RRTRSRHPFPTRRSSDLLIDAGAHVVFVSHVHLPGGSGESDKAAIHLVRSMLTENEASQTSMLPPDLDAAQLKWCIGAMDWFVGDRKSTRLNSSHVSISY